MSFVGRIIAGARDLSFGGPLGNLLAGAASLIPSWLPPHGQGEDASRDPRRRIAFTIAVIALGAKMAKADGAVTRDEVAAFGEVFQVPPGEEEDRIRAAREAIGSDIHLMLDVNNAWADLPTALVYCKRFEKYNPYWIEEPFSPDDIENHSKLAASITTQIATGEIEAGRWRFKELLEKHAAAILQPDAAVCGGIS